MWWSPWTHNNTSRDIPCQNPTGRAAHRHHFARKARGGFFIYCRLQVCYCLSLTTQPHRPHTSSTGLAEGILNHCRANFGQTKQSKNAKSKGQGKSSRPCPPMPLPLAATHTQHHPLCVYPSYLVIDNIYITSCLDFCLFIPLRTRSHSPTPPHFDSTPQAAKKGVKASPPPPRRKQWRKAMAERAWPSP